MKNKQLFLTILSTLIILVIGYDYYQKSIKPAKYMDLWISSIQTKNLKDFNKYTDSETLISSISDGYQVYTAKTENTGNIEDFFTATKNSFLGFIYKTFEKDFYNIIDSYFKDETNFSIFYKDDEILSFIKNIDFKTVTYKKLQANNYLISFYNTNVDSNFSINVITEFENDPSGDSRFKVKSVKNFNEFLKEYYVKKQQKLDRINDGIKKDINNNVLITYFESKTFNYFGSTGFSTKHRIKIKNIGDRTIFALKYKVWVFDEINNENVERVVYLKKQIAPNQEVEDFIRDISPMFNVMMLDRNKIPKAEIIFVDFLQYQLEYRSDLEYK